MRVTKIIDCGKCVIIIQNFFKIQAGCVPEGDFRTLKGLLQIHIHTDYFVYTTWVCCIDWHSIMQFTWYTDGSVPGHPEVKQLVEGVKKLGIEEHAARTRQQKAAARANTLSKRQELTSVLKCKGRERLEAKVQEVEQAKDDGCKMFAALRALGIRSTSGVSITDSEVRALHNIETQASLLTAHFKVLFAPNMTTNPRPPLCTELCYPIT